MEEKEGNCSQNSPAEASHPTKLSRLLKPLLKQAAPTMPDVCFLQTPLLNSAALTSALRHSVPASTRFPTR